MTWLFTEIWAKKLRLLQQEAVGNYVGMRAHYLEGWVL